MPPCRYFVRRRVDPTYGGWWGGGGFIGSTGGFSRRGVIRSRIGRTGWAASDDNAATLLAFPHLASRHASITRSIAGCLRFLTLTQCFDRPA
jgi:hypothetical protein